MAVADIPVEQIVNVRSSWDQFLWELPGSGLYRWDKNIGYMYAVGAIPVPGQGLPPGPPIPNPDAPFTDGEINYLNAIYIRSVNGLKPDEGGDISIVLDPVAPEDGWTEEDFSQAVQATLDKANTAVQTVNGVPIDANGNVNVASGAGGTVKSVNTKSPDGSGNVTLAAADVGAAPTAHTHTASQISDASSVGQSVLTAADAATARTAIAAAGSAITITGTGSLTGGGSLAANRTLDLSSAAKTSLGKADTAVQPADAAVAIGAWKSWSPSGYTSSAQYRLTPDGVEWIGQLTLTSGNHPTNANNTVGTVPNEAIPKTFTRLAWWMYGTVFAGLQINTTGVMTLTTGSVAGADFYLNGLRYPR